MDWSRCRTEAWCNFERSTCMTGLPARRPSSTLVYILFAATLDTVYKVFINELDQEYDPIGSKRFPIVPGGDSS